MKTMIRGHMFDFRLVCKAKIKKVLLTLIFQINRANFMCGKYSFAIYLQMDGAKKICIIVYLLNIRSGVSRYIFFVSGPLCV